MSATGTHASAAPATARDIPAVDRLLQHEAAAALGERYSQGEITAALRAELQCLREGARAGTLAREALAPAAIVQAAAARLAAARRPSLRRVINATGIIVHTNLGRAPLADAALAAIAEIASGYSNLEHELAGGTRGSRNSHVEALLCRLTGAEAALVVNNCAGAILLALAAHGRGGGVIVSRGELIEIGGAFRMPEVIAESGARLVEVGTTNRTRLEDYEAAIGADTRVLLSSHPSNYRIVGFTEAAPLEALAALARERGLRCIQDLGSGALASDPACPGEPSVAEALAAGVDLVTFSGDKLLGGPQAGICLGRAEAVAALRRHPLQRALRIDKLSLAALEATLQLYATDREAQIPVRAMLRFDAARLRQRTEAMAARLRAECGLEAEIIEAEAFAGGGAMAGQAIATPAIALAPVPAGAAGQLAALRAGSPPVIARIHRNRVVLNLLTVAEADEPALVAALAGGA